MSTPKATERYELDNLAAALVIVGDVERYGGEASGLAIWARLVLLHHREHTGSDARSLPFANRRDCGVFATQETLRAIESEA